MSGAQTTAIGVGIAVGLLPIPFAGLATRLLLALGIIHGFFLSAGRLRVAEVRWLALLVATLAGTVPSVLFASDTAAALADFGRQTFVVGFSVFLMLALRTSDARRWLASSAAIPALMGAGLTLALFATYGGGLDLVALRAFKFRVREDLSIDLNPISFAITLAAILAWPSLRHRQVMRTVVLGSVVVAVLLAGSRTTLASVILAAAVWGYLLLLARLPRVLRLAGYGAALAAAVAAVAFALSLARDPIGELALSEISAGRWQLWHAAWEKFTLRPWVGWGARSWGEGLVNYLPWAPPEVVAQIMLLSAGGFHNAYLSLLAEKGLSAFLPVMAMLIYLYRQSMALYRARATLPPFEQRLARVAPFFVLLVLVRQVAEVGGLIGYANAAIDYLEFAAASLFVAAAADLPARASPSASASPAAQGVP